MTQRMNRKNTSVLSCFCFILFLMNTPVFAEDALTPRIQIGLNLIPAVLAANKNLNAEQDPALLTVHVVYLQNIQRAIKSGNQLESVDAIRGHRLIIKVTHLDDLLGQTLEQNDSLFISEKMGRHLDALIRYAHAQQVILFSPFKGDVQKGVMSGFEVTNKVLPAINLKAMRNSNIHLKAFFLRIAVKYEQ